MWVKCSREDKCRAKNILWLEDMKGMAIQGLLYDLKCMRKAAEELGRIKLIQNRWVVRASKYAEVEALKESKSL